MKTKNSLLSVEGKFYLHEICTNLRKTLLGLDRVDKEFGIELVVKSCNVSMIR
jgi:hypothetical protein